MHEGNRKVEEDVSELVFLKFFEHLYQLEGLEASNSGSRSCKSRHNATCLEFDVDPVHWVQLIVQTTAVCHAVHKVNVVVAVVVFLKSLCANDILVNWLALFQLKSFE